MKRPQFTSGEFYHIYNRGVEKRKVFLERRDYFRFIQNLHEFNDELPVINVNHRFLQSKQPMEVELPYKNADKKLIEVIAFCLMPNHFHLILQQVSENGVVKFMQKLGTGYTNYFNIKNDRVGPLFQGRFKAVLIDNNVHLRYLPHYIHLNPLDLSHPEWREHRISNLPNILRQLANYPWSSYRDYLGFSTFPELSKKILLPDQYCGGYKKDIIDWINDMKIETISDITLE